MPKKKSKSSSGGVGKDLMKQIKADLLQKKALLTRNISSEFDEMRTQSERHHLADMDDLGGDANDEETSFKILELESAELSQIDYALERIEEGTYGSCEECEKPIGKDRLVALPFASMCIECKRVQEVSDSDF